MYYLNESAFRDAFMLIIFAGLPGTGKTTLATELALSMGATYVRIDTIEQAMVRSSLRINSAEDAGYLVGYSVAEDNLKIGRTVIADSVNPIDITRSAWLKVAKNAERPSVEVEVICSDLDKHRHRVETRVSDIDGLVVPTWQEVLYREYRAWTRDRIVIDTADKSLHQSLDELMSHILNI